MKLKALALFTVVGLYGCNKIPETVVGQLLSVTCDRTCMAIIVPIDTATGKLSTDRVNYSACIGDEARTLVDKKVFGFRRGGAGDLCMRFSEYR